MQFVTQTIQARVQRYLKIKFNDSLSTMVPNKMKLIVTFKDCHFTIENDIHMTPFSLRSSELFFSLINVKLYNTHIISCLRILI